MLRTDLTDLVNEGTTWAFIGSGPSTEAGHPNWRALVDGCLTLPNDIKAQITDDAKFTKAYEAGHYETCLTVVEKYAGREHLEKAVVSQLVSNVSPGPL